MNLITIFTPTYNRAYILKYLYESLCAQINKGFLWSIVDDGSTDNTEMLVKSWVSENKINIIYEKQENQGKHIAHNKGIDKCNTELFFCVDSDDRLTEDAVQIIYDLYNEEKDRNILGFYLRKGDLNGNATGENWPLNIKYASLNDLYQKYGFKGELAIILKTELIKPYRFPKFNKEKFIRETVFYDQINSIAPMLLKNTVCYLFEYKEDGYTAQSIKLEFRNPIGTGYNYLHHIKYTFSYIEKCKLMGMFYAWKSVMHVNDPIYKTIQIPIYIRLLGFMLKLHYKKLFTEYKKELDNEI